MVNPAATIVLTISWLISSCLAFPAANPTLASSATESTIARRIVPLKAEFGVLRIDSTGKSTFTPTDKILLYQGGKYGWRIQLKNHHGKVTWREVLQLPKSPETWATDDGQNFSLSQDGTEAVTMRTQSAQNGVIQNFWTMVPGDPSGQHQIQVYIDNHLVCTFDFEVISLRE